MAPRTLLPYLALATDAVALLENALLHVHGEPELGSEQHHLHAVNTLLYAADALSFAVLRYRMDQGLIEPPGDPPTF